MRFSASRIAGFVLSVGTFAVINYRNLSRGVLCDDCFQPYGLPFTFFIGGGFGGGGGIVWTGITGDLLTVVVCGAAVAWLLDRISNAGKSQRPC